VVQEAITMQWTVENVPTGTKIFQDGVELTHVVSFDTLTGVVTRYITNESGDLVGPRDGEDWLPVEEVQLVGNVKVVFPEKCYGL
jgi:hypothetical protein